MGYEEYKDIDSKELVRMALVEEDDEKYWDYIGTVHLRGEKKIFELAADMCNSEIERERDTGVDILSQLSIKNENDRYDMPYREETLDIYYNMLETEKSSEVIGSILFGIGHVQVPEDTRNLEKIIKYKSHTDTHVRYGLAYALGGKEDELSISTLIELMDDPNDDVRNWSTFGLVINDELDTPEIRKALWKRVNDEHVETRCESIRGLAERRDENIYSFILKEIEEGNPIVLVFDAAIALGDSRLLAPLKKLLRDVEDEEDLDDYWLHVLQEAIKVLEDPE